VVEAILLLFDDSPARPQRWVISPLLFSSSPVDRILSGEVGGDAFRVLREVGHSMPSLFLFLFLVSSWFRFFRETRGSLVISPYLFPPPRVEKMRHFPELFDNDLFPSPFFWHLMLFLTLGYFYTDFSLLLDAKLPAK